MTQFLLAVSTELTNLNVEHLVDDGDIIVGGAGFSDKTGEWMVAGGTIIYLDLSPDPTPTELAIAIKRAVDGKRRQQTYETDVF